jgi:E-phenylitaconyl-CoA hydratase
MGVRYEKDGKVVTIRLDFTETGHRIDGESFRAFSRSLVDFRDDAGALVAIVTGTGDVFSLGADHGTLLVPWAERSFDVPPLITRGLEVWKPLIAAVNGPARGGGLEIALACDIRIASENTYFQAPQVGRGLIPGWGGTQRLPRTVSPSKAAEMILMGTPITAEEAYRIGLVNKVVPPDKLLTTAREWAEKVCENGPLAVRRAKEAMLRGRDMALCDGLALELAFFEELLRSEDYREGLQSLAQTRNPADRGR